METVSIDTEELRKMSEKLRQFSRAAGADKTITDESVEGGGFLAVAAFRASMDLHYLACLIVLSQQQEVK